MSMQKQNRDHGDRKLEAMEQMERELAEPLGHFRAALTAMAEHETERMPSRRWAASPASAAGLRRRLVMGLVPALLLLLLTAGLVMANKNDKHAVVPAQNPVTAENEPVATPKQVSDSALFTEIDEDLSENVPQSMAPLEGATASTTTHENTKTVEETNGVEK
jgi:cell division protein FtsN